MTGSGKVLTEDGEVLTESRTILTGSCICQTLAGNGVILTRV